MANRFRNFLPVVVDIETGGFDCAQHAILEIAWVFLEFTDQKLVIKKSGELNIAPHSATKVEAASLAITGIDLLDENRGAVMESEGLKTFFQEVRGEIKSNACQRAILVAHNASFDQGFLHAGITRNHVKRDPFHPFSTLDTAAMAALTFGHTVLSRACEIADIEFDPEQAHSALYDATKTAELFCKMVNAWTPTYLNLTNRGPI